MTAMCWLHPEGHEHEADRPAGLRLDTGEVIPIDRSCRNAETIDDGLVVDRLEVDAGWVRS